MEFCQNEFLVTNFILRHDPAGMLLMGIYFLKNISSCLLSCYIY